jgi:hypothetical protein
MTRPKLKTDAAKRVLNGPSATFSGGASPRARVTIVPQRGLTSRISSSAGGMIAKIFFLAKIIHRIGTRNLRQEKSLLENPAGYRIFFTLRQLGRQLRMISHLICGVSRRDVGSVRIMR